MMRITLVLLSFMVRLSQRAPDGIVLKAEVIRAVAGLGELEHDAVAVVGLAADDGQAVVIPQLQVFFVDCCHFFYGHDALAGYDGDMKCIFQIVIDGVFSDFFCELADDILQKIVVIDDECLAVQIVKSLQVIKLRADWKASPIGYFFFGCNLLKTDNLRHLKALLFMGGIEQSVAMDGR